MPSDEQLDLIVSSIQSGKLDPTTLPPEKRASLKTSLQEYQARKQKAPEEKKGVFGRIWDALSIPEKLSKSGLTQIASGVKSITPQVEPTGNMVRDVALNTPSILTQSAAETAAKVAPGFVSPLSIVTAGGLRMAKAATPLIKALGSQVGRAAEGLSGLEYKTPGILAEAAKDSSLIFGKGKEEAGAAYEAIKDNLQIRPSMLTATSSTQLLDDAKYALENGDLTPQEALMARRTVDKVGHTLPPDSAIYLRNAFDKVAKTISSVADSDFAKAIKSEELRRIFAINKSGGTSIAKNILFSLPMGGLPLVLGSPAFQGAVATGLGATARALSPLASNAVQSGSAIGGLSPQIQALLRQREKQNGR